MPGAAAQAGFPAAQKRCLGGCAGGFSAEHVITGSLFAGKEICINGLPWCRTRSITMPPRNFTANILCRKHNSDLSLIDDAGLATFKAFRDAGAEQDARHRYLSSGLAPYRFPVLQHEVDGYNFERWLLKTLINMELAGDQALPIGRPGPNNERPPRDLVEMPTASKTSSSRRDSIISGASGKNSRSPSE